MGKYPSIFQAEVFAICVCVGECLRRGTRGATIYILSDSQAALKALAAYNVTSGLVMECIDSLNRLGLHNSLTLGWVPSHEGHAGNERADCLANCGARRPFIGPEPFCGVPSGYIRERLKGWRESEFQAYWAQSSGQRQAKLFISPSGEKSRKLLSMTRGELRTVTGYLTGHCDLRYQLYKMGRSSTETCRFCELEPETSEHVLCRCPRLFDRRVRYFGDRVVTPSDVWDSLPGRIVGFVRSLNL